MSWIKRLGGRLPDFEDVVRRFPVAVITMAIATIWLIVEIHFDGFHDQPEYVFGGFILAGYAAVIGHLIAESRGWTALKSAIVAMLLAAPAFLFSAFDESLNFNVVFGISAAILFLGNAAAWRKSRDDPAVWNFTQKLWTGAIFAVVGSLIFAAGMFIISEAVKALFGFNLEDLTIKTLLPIGLLFLAPVYWLGTLPRYGEAEDVGEISFEARALSFLGTWMLAPLVITYAIIVLAYGAKVLVQWELPKGEIAMLVSPFLGVGMLVWLMLEPKVLKESGFVRFYRAAWHWIMLPAAVLLGVSVFVRIREYGFTVERVFLTLVFIWALVQSLWFTVLPKIKRDIRIPTAIAAGLLIFGAFAAQPISTLSQFKRALQAKSELPAFEAETFRNNPELAKQFLSGVEYLIKQGDEAKFRRLFPNQDSMPKNAYGPNYEALLTSFGLNEVTVEKRNRRTTSTFTISTKQPLSLSEDSNLYVGPTVRLYETIKKRKARGIVSSQRGHSVVLSVNGETYHVNFSDEFSNLELVGQDDIEVDTIVPLMSIVSDDGVPATLVILDGSLNFIEQSFSSGDVNFAVIVPN